MNRSLAAVGLSILIAFLAAPLHAQDCAECHQKGTPGIVADWKASKHGQNEVLCCHCHGHGHEGPEDSAKAIMPGPDICASCHEKQVKQFTAGKHARAWEVMKAMPTMHHQPMVIIEGMKGCGGCHKIGIKGDAAVQDMKKLGLRGYGIASCDACHTRHSFSVAEARQPQACRTCHMGFDHPQWEMYHSSKHGVRSELKQLGVLPADVPAPTCQTCHMQEGDHEVRTAWGFLGVRLPLPGDRKWASDRSTILKALGLLDPSGKPTPRLHLAKAADMARFDEEGWQRERRKTSKVCTQCHSGAFAGPELQKGDDMIRHVDSLMAEAIGVVANLYRDGILKKSGTYTHPYPDILTLHDAPTAIEQKLFLMFFEHRMRAFQGTFHASPDYAVWYGWSEMRRDLTEIKEEARRMRTEGKRK